MRTYILIVGLLACQCLAKTLDQDEKVEDTGIVKSADGEGHERVHPCSEKHCAVGYECDLDENGDAVCICLRDCPYVESDTPICTTANETFDSECALYREQCLCRHQESGCQEPEVLNTLMDYYGKCKEMALCDEDDLLQFPHRMREWLFLVMEELDERGDLSIGAHDMLKEARTHTNHWAIPVIWKFCDLDTSADRFVTPLELLPVSAPLKPLERCTAPFLDNCDEDDNGRIDIIEWGNCLELDQDEIADKCDALRN